MESNKMTILFTALSIAFFCGYIHYRKLGGAWFDDWTSSTVEPKCHIKSQLRMRMEGICLKCRICFIFAVLFAAAAVVRVIQ